MNISVMRPGSLKSCSSQQCSEHCHREIHKYTAARQRANVGFEGTLQGIRMVGSYLPDGFVLRLRHARIKHIPCYQDGELVLAS